MTNWPLSPGQGPACIVSANKAPAVHADQHAKGGSDSITPESIGAAPGGFGLGANGFPYAYTTVTGDTVNNLSRSGLYWFEDATNPLYADGYNSGTVGLLLHLQGSIVHTTSARQIFFPDYPVNGAGRNCRVEREKTGDGEWLPWEFVNPPIVYGIEYRTTERYLGKPVYVKNVDCGYIPSPGTQKTVAHGINNCLPIMVTADMSNSNTIPWLGAYTVGADNTNVVLCSPSDKSDFSNCTATAILKYRKSTD